MHNHTPGPWRVTGPNVRAGDALLAVVTDHWADHPTPDNEKANNARLIAAAPDLLAQLVKMTDAYAKAMKDAGVTYYPEALADVRAARAAIAKATGGNV